MPSLRQPASQRPMRILGRSGWRRDPPGPPGADWPGPAGPKEGPRGPIASAGTSDGEPRSPRGPAGSTQSTPRSSPRTDRSGGAGAERWRLGPIPEGGEGGWGKERPPVGWRAKYRRVMLKVSGEALGGNKGFGIDPQVLMSVAQEVANAHRHGIQIAIVVGGGNYFRGRDSWEGLNRATGDYVGMLATTMNAVCMQSALESLGVSVRVQTAIEIKELAEPYIRRKAIRHLEMGRVVVFGAGTGSPFFSTDTAAALRAAEVNAEVFLKATKLDGFYAGDPLGDPSSAVRWEHLSYADARLNGMDGTAVGLCRDNRIPIVIHSLCKPGNILKAIMGEPVGTLVDWRPTEPPRDRQLLWSSQPGGSKRNGLGL